MEEVEEIGAMRVCIGLEIMIGVMPLSLTI